MNKGLRDHRYMSPHVYDPEKRKKKVNINIYVCHKETMPFYFHQTSSHPKFVQSIGLHVSHCTKKSALSDKNKNKIVLLLPWISVVWIKFKSPHSNGFKSIFGVGGASGCSRFIKEDDSGKE